MLAMYVFSTAMALLVAAVLSRTFAARVATFRWILEMPPYRRPHVRDVLRMMWNRSSMFLREAGGRHTSVRDRAVGVA